jgi:hypothetical protein
MIAAALVPTVPLKHASAIESGMYGDCAPAGTGGFLVLNIFTSVGTLGRGCGKYEPNVQVTVGGVPDMSVTCAYSERFVPPCVVHSAVM